MSCRRYYFILPSTFKRTETFSADPIYWYLLLKKHFFRNLLIVRFGVGFFGQLFSKVLVSISTILGKVAESYGLPVKGVLRSGRGRGAESTPRMVAMALCRRPGGHSLKAIGEAVQSSYSSVSAAGKRLTEMLQTDPLFEKNIQSLISTIFNNQFKT